MIIINAPPKHIGIIPDGNRRLARRLMKKPWKGHEWGLKKIKKIIEWCDEFGVRVVTLYALSLENYNKRPKREIKYLLSLADKEMKSILEDRNHIVHKNKVKINFFGKMDVLPGDTRAQVKKVMTATRDYSSYFLNIAIAYSGRQEIIEAFRRMATDTMEGKLSPEDINENSIKEYLWTNGFGDPEMIIRTGGEKRLSNFLPYQSAYSELVFVEKMWPEFGKTDFRKSIQEFKRRQRRFGK